MIDIAIPFLAMITVATFMSIYLYIYRSWFPDGLPFPYDVHTIKSGDQWQVHHLQFELNPSGSALLLSPEASFFLLFLLHCVVGYSQSFSVSRYHTRPPTLRRYDTPHFLLWGPCHLFDSFGKHDTICRRTRAVKLELFSLVGQLHAVWWTRTTIHVFFESYFHSLEDILIAYFSTPFSHFPSSIQHAFGARSSLPLSVLSPVRSFRCCQASCLCSFVRLRSLRDGLFAGFDICYTTSSINSVVTIIISSIFWKPPGSCRWRKQTPLPSFRTCVPR
jgi:hypothetical protein